MPDFDDPFKSPESTVLRPRPGAGRRGPAEAAPRPSPGVPTAEPVSAAAIEELGLGLNPLVRAASGLLMLTGQLRGTLAGPDIPTLRRYALDEIRRFEDRSRAAGVQNEVMLAARYALCAGLDEAVLSTPWGAQSEWAQQTLLVALHREAYGGEKFFEMLDRISSDPKRHIDLMELQYLCLALGFAGKYQVADRGHVKLSDVQHDLYRRIRDYRGVPPTDLSLRWRGLEDRRNPLIRYVPWWVVGAAALVVVAVAYATFYSLLYSHRERILTTVDGMGKPAKAVTSSPSPGPSLKSLLHHLEDGRTFEIEEGNGTTKVILSGLFASGQWSVSEPFQRLIVTVAEALNQMPDGSVMVIGHADGQNYQDNEGLSMKRAQSVLDLLRKSIKRRGRLEPPESRGARELRFPDKTDARNRRVEIVLGGS